MLNRLKLPEDYIVDESCIELVKFHLCNYILKEKAIQAQIDMGIQVYLSNPLHIKYNHKNYYVSIVRDSKNYYWYYRPYKKNSYFTLKTNGNIDNFAEIIKTIIESSKNTSK